MFRCSNISIAFIILIFLGNFAFAQDSIPDKLKDQVGEIGDKVGEIGKTLDTVPIVKEVSAGILQPIYDAAQFIAFPSFYWIAFALMAAGVVSYAFQLVFSKFFLLLRMHINIKEIMSDILGLLVSVIGLILTTQAATQNSTFPDSPAMVVSATVVGVITGFVFYLWGQKQEFQASKKPTKIPE